MLVKLVVNSAPDLTPEQTMAFLVERSLEQAVVGRLHKRTLPSIYPKPFSRYVFPLLFIRGLSTSGNIFEYDYNRNIWDGNEHVQDLRRAIGTRYRTTEKQKSGFLRNPGGH